MLISVRLTVLLGGIYEEGLKMEETTPHLPVICSSGLCDEAIKLLAELVEAIHIKPEDRTGYDLRPYANHAPDCKRPQGDQCCQCGYSQVRFNLGCILDECEGYQGRAPIDRACELLKRAGLMTPNAPR